MARSNSQHNIDNLKVYTIPAELEDGFILDDTGYFSIIKAEESINLIPNPEVATLTSYGGSATISLDAATQWVGVNSIYAEFLSAQTITVTLTPTLTSNTPYTFSFYATGGGMYTVYATDAGGVQTTVSKNLTLTKYWNRYTYTFTDPLGTATKLVIRAYDVSSGNFDGFQLEQLPYATTFISGSLAYPVIDGIERMYYWLGEPHNSYSMRSRNTNSGGRVFLLSELGVQVLGYENMGAPKFDHTITQLAYGTSFYYESSRPAQRTITLLCQITTNNIKDLLAKRSALINLVSPYNNVQQKPIRLLYQLVDNDIPKSNYYYIDCVYSGGLEGNTNTYEGERFGIEFTLIDSLITEYKQTTVAIDTIASVTLDPLLRSAAVIADNPNAGMLHLDTNFPVVTSTYLFDALVGTNNNLFCAGNMEIDSSSNTMLAEYDGSEWAQRVIALGGPGDIATIVAGSDNSIYFGGSFIFATDATLSTTISPIAPALISNIGRYDIVTNTIAAIGCVYIDGLVAGQVRKIIYTKYNGNDVLIIGGTFNRIRQTSGVVITAINLAMYDIAASTWSNMSGVGNTLFGAVASGTVFNIMLDNTNVLWIGGRFDGQTASTDYSLATTYTNICRINLNTMSPMQTDQLVAGGSGTGSILTTTLADPGVVYSIIQMPSGDIYAAGRFDSTGVLETESATYLTALPNSLPDIPVSLAKWNGSKWVSANGTMFVNRRQTPAPLIGTVFDIRLGNNNDLLVAGQYDYIGQLYVNGYVATDTQWGGAHALTLYPVNATGFARLNSVTGWRSIILTEDTNFRTIGRFIIDGTGYNNNAYQKILTTGLSPSSSINIYYPGISNNTFYGGEFAGTLYFITPSLIATPNTVDIKPTIAITGPATVGQITNTVTGATITFTGGIKLAVNETLVIDLTGLRPVVFTTLQGNVLNKVGLASGLYNFGLISGDNYIRVGYVEIPAITTADPFPKAIVTYSNKYLSVDAAGV
jgi:hypothetical protein